MGFTRTSGGDSLWTKVGSKLYPSDLTSSIDVVGIDINGLPFNDGTYLYDPAANVISDGGTLFYPGGIYNLADSGGIIYYGLGNGSLADQNGVYTPGTTQVVFDANGALYYPGAVHQMTDFGGNLLAPSGSQLMSTAGLLTCTNLRVNNAPSAPTTTATPTFTSYYGGNTKALGDPVAWLTINCNGTNRKIPCY